MDAQAQTKGTAVELLRGAARAAAEYVDTIGERRVFPSSHDLDALQGFEEPLPEQPTSPTEVLAMLAKIGSPATVATTGGRYFGFVVGGALPVSVAANWLATAWDQNAALELLSPVVSCLERVCERWILDLLDLPAEAAVGFVSGASEANFAAMAAARYHLLKRAGWSSAEHGLFNAPPIRVVLSEDVHQSVHRALALLGIGRRQCEEVPVDREGRIRVGAIPTLDERTLVILQAGHINTGSFDRFLEVQRHARETEAWIHVEGAYGLWAAASSRFRHLLEGCEQADSWAVDSHKYINVPYDSGLVICRDRKLLIEAMDLHAPYLHFSRGRDGCRLTPVLSRRARVVDLWATIKSLGKSEIAKIIERTCDLAQRMADGLERAGFEILNDVVLNQVLVGCAGDSQAREIVRMLQASGECWCGTSSWRNRIVIRLSISSWATTESDVDRTVGAFECARRRAATSPT